MVRKKPGVGKSAAKPSPPAPSTSALPAGYAGLLADLKDRIRSAQVKAAVAVNRELIGLYWEIGQAIVERQEREGWGISVVGRLAEDLQKEFPGEGGFSPRNIWRMRAFYLAWTQEVTNLSQAVTDLPSQILSQAATDLPSQIAQRAAAQLPSPILAQAARELDGKRLPAPCATIPWGHNVVLVESLKDPAERLWYATMTVEAGWSRAVLVHQIESGLCERQGKALTNFTRTLPAPQSDLAGQLLKDTYNFEFLTLADATRESDLQRGLLVHLRDFLPELGVGGSLVGGPYHLVVGGQDYYLDLLFYHLRLRCFVILDLKMVAFVPEFAGKMNFYLSAADDLLRHKDDQPSIGLILCKEKNKVIVEYSLRDTSKPMGVASYTLRQALPAGLRDSLPSVEALEAELRKAEVETGKESRTQNGKRVVKVG